MFKPHLISTSAHFKDLDRINRYKESYGLISNYKELFNSVSILETVSKSKLDYLEDTGFNVFYSPLGNHHPNKGVNWIIHLSYFLFNCDLKDDDIIVFITGRYNILNINMLFLIEKYMVEEKNEFIAKEDGSVFEGDNGVHTFYIAFTKAKFLNFFEWYKINGRTQDCIEWDVKKYLATHEKCLILPKNFIMGVELQMIEYPIKHIC